MDLTWFQQLSFYRPGLVLNKIFYGDWQYDVVHGRVTQYQDEFGDIIIEPGAGPQASFWDDMDAALFTTGRQDHINVIKKI